MKCLECGYEITDNSKFCLQCGAKINKCSQCGNINATNAKFCSNCGNIIIDVDSSSVKDETDGVRKKGKFKSILFKICIVIIALVICSNIYTHVIYPKLVLTKHVTEQNINAIIQDDMTEVPIKDQEYQGFYFTTIKAKMFTNHLITFSFANIVYDTIRGEYYNEPDEAATEQCLHRYKDHSEHEILREAIDAITDESESEDYLINYNEISFANNIIEFTFSNDDYDEMYVKMICIKNDESVAFAFVSCDTEFQEREQVLIDKIIDSVELE